LLSAIARDPLYEFIRTFLEHTGQKVAPNEGSKQWKREYDVAKKAKVVVIIQKYY